MYISMFKIPNSVLLVVRRENLKSFNVLDLRGTKNAYIILARPVETIQFDGLVLRLRFEHWTSQRKAELPRSHIDVLLEASVCG
jgi:hypothetical protein